MPEIPSFIAVIDDDESMCHALGRLLRLAGYDVRTYVSAETYLQDPDHHLTRFLVADIQLRGMSGFDLQRRVAETQPGLPFAFITAHDQEETRALAAESGCAMYLRKPFPGSTLLDGIAKAMGGQAGTEVPNPAGIKADSNPNTP